MDKVLALGRAEEAERMLAPRLHALLEGARAGLPDRSRGAEQGARHAVKLAAATGKGGWVDYVFQLFSCIRRPLPGEVIDELYEVLRRVDDVTHAVTAGDKVRIQIAAQLGALTPDDVRLECVIGIEDEHHDFQASEYFAFTANEKLDNGETLFILDLDPPLPGLQFYQIRMYPCHDLLSHRFETGCMIWL